MWTTERDDSGIQSIEIIFEKNLNKIKKRNNNIRLELGVDKIKNSIQKSRLRWFGHVMLMRAENILVPKKMLHKKWREKIPRTLDLEASTLPRDHRGRLSYAVNTRQF